MADNEDGRPYATRSDQPDMQGAGVVNPPTSSPLSLIDALSSIGGNGGGIPAPPPGPGMAPPGMGMGGLMGMLPPPSSQASVFAQALSGGISAMRGQADPVQAMVNQQQQQQNAIGAMMMKMAEQQRLATQWGITNQRLQASEDRREKHELFAEQDKTKTRALEMGKLKLGALDSFMGAATDPGARADLAKQKAAVMEQMMGTPVPQNVIEGWALPSPITEQRNKQIAAAFNTAGADPEKQQIAAQQFRLDPTSVKFYTTMVKDPAFLAANGIESPDVLHGKEIDRQVKEEELFDRLAKRNAPEMVGDPKFAMAMRSMSQTLFPNQEYTGLSEPQKAQVFNGVHQQAKVEEERKIRLQNQLMTDRQLQILGARQEGQAAKPTNPAIVQKLTEPFDKGVGYLKSIALLRADLNAIPEDALPSSMDKASQLWAQLKRNTVYANDQGVYNLAMHWAPVSVGFDRSFFDDKGVRIAAAFGPTLQAVDHLPPRKVMETYLNTLEAQVTDQLQRHLSTAELPGRNTPPEVLESARFLTAPYLKQTPTTPLAPLTIQKTGKFLDTKTGKTVEATYSPGDPIPPNYIEIK